MRYKDIPVFKKIRNAALTAITVLALGVAINTTSFISFAESAGKITATTCNVRADASTQSASIGSKSKDETIKILGQKTGADGYVWYQIYINATTVGYVRSDLATITDGTTPDTIDENGNVTSIDDTVTACNPISGTVSGGQAVRVRADASTSSTIVSSAASGTTLTVNGTKTGSDGRDWYYVEYNNEGTPVKGFIRSDFITLSGTLTPLTTESDTPAATEPAPVTPDSDTTSEPATVDAPFAVAQENGTWVFFDYAGNQKYEVNTILDVVHKYENKELTTAKKGGAAKTVWLIIFIIIAIGASAAAVYFFLKLRELGDKSAFADAEKERKARQANNAAKNGTARPAGANGTRPAGSAGATRPAGTARPAGATGATRPAGAGAPRPTGAAAPRPAGAGAPRPAGAGAPRPAGAGAPRPAGAGAPRPAGATAPRPAGAGAPRPAGAVPPRPVQSAEPVKANPQPAARTSVDDDDEFEFGFLNWDGDDKK
ncbi:MAG: SH3 domain-containing protein [Lachnospiraceae bacterium]|nr:SH3 domain-containing protein [Lachnospiraceae bacterium]